MNKHRTMIELIDKEDAISACNAQVWEGEALADIKNCIKPVLTIPENPTNGDIFKAIFSNLTIYENRKNEDYPYVDVFISEHDSTCYPKDWWNAPYEQEGEADDE